MPAQRWTHSERKVAALLDGRWLSTERAGRDSLPAWLTDAIRQAEATASPHQLPIAVVSEPGRRDGEALVVVRLEAFAEWFGDDGESRICRAPAWAGD